SGYRQMKKLLFIFHVLLLLLYSCGSKSRIAPQPTIATAPASIDTAITLVLIDTVSPDDTIEQLANDSTDTTAYIDYTHKLRAGHASVDTFRIVDVLVLHSSHALGADTFSVDGVIALYNRYRVGAHYLIGREGQIYRLANENDVAFHAGESFLPCDTARRSLNRCSIGIEIINGKTSGPTPEQYDALLRLVDDIRGRHPISYIYGHSHIAPSRKTDPWAFDWPYFYEQLQFTNPAHSDTTIDSTAVTLPTDGQRIDVK
ncbi:MAG: N-acetylmuramoyl-L-alanine amidase, partial [Bacteroidales bacterium]|nr:N-acetylmuramoyl-L-alanine amidase [Bacteroidales bacterium]